jgi:hypothetical protein
MGKLWVFNMAKLAMPLVLLLAFVLPSAALLLGSNQSHLLTLEVCTDHGIELVGLGSQPSDVPQPAKVLDHCPLCQLQVVPPLVPHLEAFIGLKAQTVLVPLGHSQLTSTLVAWSFLPSRAPPAFI